MKNIKQLSIILLLLISSIAYAQKPTVDYLKYKKYTTAQKNAISVTDTTKVYIVFDKDLDKLQIYKNGAWKEITPQAALDLKADKTYVDDKIDELLNGSTSTVTLLPIFKETATYTDINLISQFITGIECSEFAVTDNLYLRQIRDEGNGTVYIEIRDNDTNSNVFTLTTAITTGVQTYSAPASNSRTIELTLDFDNIVYLNYSDGNINATPFNMEQFVNGQPTSETTDGLLADIETAKQEAIDASALDATTKANTAEANAKAYTDQELAGFTGGISEQDVDDKIDELLNGESGTVTLLPIFKETATYTDINLLAQFITGIECNEFAVTDNLYLRQIRNEGNGTVYIEIRDNDTNSNVFTLTTAITTGVQTYSAPASNSRTIELTLDFDNIVYLSYSDGNINATPFNMEQFVNGQPTSETTDGLLADIATAKQEAITESKAYTDSELAEFSGDSSLDVDDYANIYPDPTLQNAVTDYSEHSNNASFQTGSATISSGGIRFQATNYQSGRLEVIRSGLHLKPSKRYALTATYEVGANTLPEQVIDGSFWFDISFEGHGVQASIGGYNVRSQFAGRTFTETIFFDFDETFVEDLDARIFIRTNFYNVTGVDLDVTIKSIKMVELSLDLQEKYSSRYFNTLQRKLGVKSQSIVQVSEFSVHHNSIYYGRKLITWGASTTENCSWQPTIADYFGMNFSENLTKGDGVDGYTETAKGGTWTVPIITSSTNKGAGDSSYATIKEAFKYYDDLYTNEYGKPLHIFFLGHNEATAGTSYTAESSFTVPSDYGLNDAPYTGNEIDLVTTPAESNLPTFGAAYRGILEYCFAQSPDAEIMLMNLYYLANDNPTITDKFNDVIDAVAYDYKLKVLDMTRLWNHINEDYYLQDVIHQNKFGGIKQGRAAISQM